MFLALREQRRAKTRFGLLISAVALLVFLILTQQALQDGLITSFLGAIRTQSAPVLVYSVAGQRVLQGSIITPELQAIIDEVDVVGGSSRAGDPHGVGRRIVHYADRTVHMTDGRIDDAESGTRRTPNRGPDIPGGNSGGGENAAMGSAKAGRASGDETDELIVATEQWFLQRGIPHFIEDYDAGEDIFTRAFPVLGLVFGLEILGATSLDWSWWQNALAVVGAIAVVVGLWAGLNRARGRARFEPPDDIGPVELASFVLIPALLPVLFGGQVGAAALTALFNLVVLGLIYLVTSYGLVPMTRWAFVQTGRQAGAVLSLFGRALPLLLLFSVALFVNTEVWQVSAALDGALFWSTIGFFVLAGLGFLLVRLPGEIALLREQVDGEALADACAESPLADLAAEVDRASGPGDGAAASALTRRQEGNVLLVLLFSQAVQVLLVTVAIGSFFFAFGLLAIRPEVIDLWLGDNIGRGELARWTLAGREIVLTRALLHVAGFLGALSGFYFTVYVITDRTYREQFFTEIIGQVRQSLAVRSVYLRLVRSAAE